MHRKLIFGKMKRKFFSTDIRRYVGISEIGTVFLRNRGRGRKPLTSCNKHARRCCSWSFVAVVFTRASCRRRGALALFTSVSKIRVNIALLYARTVFARPSPPSSRVHYIVIVIIIVFSGVSRLSILFDSVLSFFSSIHFVYGPVFVRTSRTQCDLRSIRDSEIKKRTAITFRRSKYTHDSDSTE